MNELQVRSATAADALGVATVHVDSWRDAYSGLIADDVLDSLSVKQRAEGWSRWIQASFTGARTDTGTDTPHRLLVAEIGDRIVGWASFGAGRDSEASHLGELAGLYVHPEFWSKMIGHALMTHVDQELIAEGWDEAYLWVLHGNDRAIRFYEQHGWYADGIEKVDAAGGASNLRELRFRRVLC